MDDITELYTGSVNAHTMAELSAQYVSGSEQRRAILKGWEQVFDAFRNERVAQPQLQTRNRFGKDSGPEYQPFDKLLGPKFVSAMHSIAFASRQVTGLNFLPGKGGTPTNLDNVSEDQRRRLQDASVSYRIGSKILPTTVKVGPGAIAVYEHADLVLQVQRSTNGSAQFVVRVATRTGDRVNIPVDGAASFYVIRDGIVFSDTYPLGSKLAPPGPDLDDDPDELE